MTRTPGTSKRRAPRHGIYAAAGWLLDVEQIVAWAREHYERTGAWPNARTPGIIPGTQAEKWHNINESLHGGHRGLPGSSSIARLLAERFGIRNRSAPPRLSVAQILTWADAHRQRTGEWPIAHSGPIPEAPGETWNSIDHALSNGSRGLPGGSSLPRLLAQERGRRNKRGVPRLSIGRILAWADDHHRRTKKWPNRRTREPIPGAPGETWTNLDAALRTGKRGLPRGCSLARLLAEHRGLRNRARLPPLTEGQILAWAETYCKQHGRWPREPDGRIPRSGGETWSGVDQALAVGLRGLPAGSSLPKLLARRRGHRYKGTVLELWRILRWADAHRARTGRWPVCNSGRIVDAPEETWGAIDALLRRGGRGLPGGSSLTCLLMEARQVPHRLHPQSLSVHQVLAWADEHYRRTGRWPDADSGPVFPGARVNWRIVADCFRRGKRGLPGGMTLGRFLAQRTDAGRLTKANV